MWRLEVSCAVRRLYRSLGVKGLIYDQSKISADKIHNFINHIDLKLELKISEETDNTLPYLDLSISRSNSNIELDIYRKPTYTDIMIHYTSNHPHNHKLDAFIFYINRIISMPIACQTTNQEWHIIFTMARNNGFPEHLNHELKKKLTTNKIKVTQTDLPQKQSNKWNTIFHGPPVHKVTNSFRKTGLKIAFRPNNTIFQQLTQKAKNNNPSGIYQLKYNSCNKAYVGQSGGALSLRHKEHNSYT